MKKPFPFLILFITILVCSCRDSKDYIIAEAYQSKLYFSEIEQNMPNGLSQEDSVAFIEQYVKNWISEKILIREARKALSNSEQDFDKEIAQLRGNLLINAYYTKLTSDPALFPVSDQDIQNYMKQYEQLASTEKEIIKVNYVKLGKRSKLIPVLKEILFNEKKRVAEKATIEKLCADSIEYFIDDNTWLIFDELQSELPIEIKNRESVLEKNRYIETSDKDYHYLIVFLDYKMKNTPSENEEDVQVARLMLMQQKKNEYLKQKTEELYNAALESGKVVIIK